MVEPEVCDPPSPVRHHRLDAAPGLALVVREDDGACEPLPGRGEPLPPLLLACGPLFGLLAERARTGRVLEERDVSGIVDVVRVEAGV